VTAALDREVIYNAISAEAYRAVGLPGGADGQHVQFKRDFNEMFCRVRGVELARVPRPALQTFKVWLARD